MPTQDAGECDHGDEIRRMATEQFLDEGLALIGMLSPADLKAREAARSERVEQMDAEHGRAPAKYAAFREAFDSGASCADLFEIRNRMDPKDPLKESANEDLRSVGCYSPKAARKS